MDLTTLSDADLDQHRRDVIDEQERRAKIEQLPDDLAAMARDAADAGCDPTELLERVTDALSTDQEPTNG